MESNLIQFVSDISEPLDKRLEVDVVYTDFSSAFDKVSHSLLLSNLAANGVHGSLMRWFTSYLQQSSQTVVLNGYTSQLYFSISGVPQRSHLVPILFSLFINDIVRQIKNCKFLMFTDDLKMYKTISTSNDSVAIQSDLDRIQNWCNQNGMTLNVKKCFHITFFKRKNKLVYHHIKSIA